MEIRKCLFPLHLGKKDEFRKNLAVTEEKFEMFYNRLAKVYKHLAKQARRMCISCYRIYDHDLPEFPLCIELYGEKIYVAEYKRNHGLSDESHDEWMEKTSSTVRAITGVTEENVFLKLRQRKPGRLGQYQKLDALQKEIVVEENGLKFLINLSDYLDTGLFLDHRITRQMLRDNATDKKVLNLFAYTGSFSVYAAAGGAKEVITVDLSKTYLAWAERNMELNGFIAQENYQVIHADVLQYLKKIAPGHFDIIILDPPTFSNSKRMDDFLDIQKDHVELINNCLDALTIGGEIYFSTNFREFQLNKEAIYATSIKDITKATTPFDFEGKLFRYCYLIRK